MRGRTELDEDYHEYQCLCWTLLRSFVLTGNPLPACPVAWAARHGGCCRCLLRFPALHSLDRCRPKARASHNIMITKVILTASTPVEVKVRLDSCWPGEEKGYCYWYWFGSADSCAGGRVDQPLARLFRLGEMK